jgi:hypothetical protein
MARSLLLFTFMSTGIRLAVAVTVICVAPAARADLAAVYVQGNGGVTSGSVSDRPSGSQSPSHGAAFGVQAGARLLFGEGYLDHTAFTEGGSATRYVLGVRGGAGLFGLGIFARAGVGYLDEDGGALAGGLEPMPERRGVIARAGGGLEKSLSYGLHAGAAVESEYFRISPRGVAVFGDKATSGSDLFGYLFLKFQLGI